MSSNQARGMHVNAVVVRPSSTTCTTVRARSLEWREPASSDRRAHCGTEYVPFCRNTRVTVCICSAMAKILGGNLYAVAALPMPR
eukprot:4990305-Pyramimonas_sp.AAC.1